MGIILGASLLGSFAAVLIKEPPMSTMLKLAREIKIWAIVAAIGGTFYTFEIIESGLFKGEVRPLVKQLLYIFFAIVGTQAGYYLIVVLAGKGK
jgi:hypothetical protein